MLRTRIVSDRPGRPGRSEQMPRTHRSTGTPGLGGPVQRVDHRLVDDRVALQLDPGGTALPLPGRLPLDLLQQPGPQRVRGDQEPAVGGLAAVAGQDVEQVRGVAAHRPDPR